jgi:hypothetical protein
VPAGRGGAGRRHARGARRRARRAHGPALEPLDAAPSAPAPGSAARRETLRAAERDRADVAEERNAWRAEVAAGRLDPAGLVLVDEGGAARPPAGGAGPGGHAHDAPLRPGRPPAPPDAGRRPRPAAPTATAVFRAFAEQVLAPAPRDRPGALVAMDDLAPHEAAAGLEAIRAAGPEPRPPPRRSPGPSPIEPCRSKAEALLRARRARPLDELDREPPAVLAAVTPGDARGRFRFCGYPAPD